MRFLALILMLSLLGCGSTGNEKGPQIKYKESTIEVPDIPGGSSYKGQIVLTNIGDAILRITNIRSDCACTVSEMDHKEIRPKDSSILRYTLTPNVQGRFQQTITVENNSSNEPSILFVIRSKVII